MINRETSIGNLEAWLNDAINSDATSKEVYDSLILTVREEIDYHRRCLKRSEDLLVMLKGNLSALYNNDYNEDIDKISLNDSQAYVSSKVTNAKTEQEYQDFWNPAKDDEAFEDTLKREGYEYTPIPERY